MTPWIVDLLEPPSDITTLVYKNFFDIIMTGLIVCLWVVIPVLAMCVFRWIMLCKLGWSQLKTNMFLITQALVFLFCSAFLFLYTYAGIAFVYEGVGKYYETSQLPISVSPSILLGHYVKKQVYFPVPTIFQIPFVAFILIKWKIANKRKKALA